MRARNNSENLELYAVAGTHTVVLSWDMKTKPVGLLGFAIERRDVKSGNMIWLQGQKCFASVVENPVPGQKYPTHLHPIQSFLWKDFTVVPGREYEFKVTPVGGLPTSPVFEPSQKIKIRTEKYISGKHGVYFNRGVSGSQSYAERFGNERPDQMEEPRRTLAYQWLSRGLFEGLVEFIRSAKPGEKLRGAFYEFHFQDILLEFKAAAAPGRDVDVKLVTSGKSYLEENAEAIATAHIKNLAKHVRDNQVNEPHNKFVILIGTNGKAKKVWTGSTNISEKALFGHCNTGHIISDAKIAGRYLKYWEALDLNPLRKDLREVVETIQPNVAAADMPNGITVFFSPRKKIDMLQVYADMIAGANAMVCCVYPFNIDERFQKVFKIDKEFIRYILLDSHKAFNTFQTDDRDVDVTAGSFIRNPVDQWVRETSAGSIIKSGIDFVHNKFIVIDALTATPTVVTGSANYSGNSTTLNDENTVVIKGDKRVADIYFTELVRLFDHFSFREWLNKKPDEFNPSLDETGKWINKYFDNPNNLTVKRKLVFKNMVV